MTRDRLYQLPKGSKVDILVGGASRWEADKDEYVHARDARDALRLLARRISRECSCRLDEVDGQDIARQMWELV